MKTSKKIIVAVIAMLAIACTLAFAACDPEEADNGVKGAIALASECDTTTVTLSKGDVVYYGLVKSGDSEAVVNDPYGTGVSADAFIDFAKELKASFSESDLTIVSNDYDSVGGEIALTATFKDAAKTLGVVSENVNLTIEGNLITKKVTKYVVTYVDSNGYDVNIALS